MHLIINNSKPEDFVVSTGVTHSIRDMTNYVFKKLEQNKIYFPKSKYLRPEELKYLKVIQQNLEKNSIGNQNIHLSH